MYESMSMYALRKHVCTSVYIYLTIFIDMYAGNKVCMDIYLYTFGHIYIFMCVRACAYVCLFVCVNIILIWKRIHVL